MNSVHIFIQSFLEVYIWHSKLLPWESWKLALSKGKQPAACPDCHIIPSFFFFVSYFDNIKMITNTLKNKVMNSDDIKMISNKLKNNIKNTTI